MRTRAVKQETLLDKHGRFNCPNLAVAFMLTIFAVLILNIKLRIHSRVV